MHAGFRALGRADDQHHRHVVIRAKALNTDLGAAVLHQHGRLNREDNDKARARALGRNAVIGESGKHSCRLCSLSTDSRPSSSGSTRPAPP